MSRSLKILGLSIGETPKPAEIVKEAVDRRSEGKSQVQPQLN